MVGLEALGVPERRGRAGGRPVTRIRLFTDKRSPAGRSGSRKSPTASVLVCPMELVSRSHRFETRMERRANAQRVRWSAIHPEPRGTGVFPQSAVLPHRDVYQPNRRGASFGDGVEPGRRVRGVGRHWWVIALALRSRGEVLMYSAG